MIISSRQVLKDEKLLRARIYKCDEDSLWYSDEIGNCYTVYQTKRLMDYIVKKDLDDEARKKRAGTFRGIQKEDVIIEGVVDERL